MRTSAGVRPYRSGRAWLAEQSWNDAGAASDLASVRQERLPVAGCNGQGASGAAGGGWRLTGARARMTAQPGASIFLLMCRAEAVRFFDQDLSVADTVIDKTTTEGCRVHPGLEHHPGAAMVNSGTALGARYAQRPECPGSARHVGLWDVAAVVPSCPRAGV